MILTTAPTLDTLANRLAAHLQAEQGDPFDPTTLVVPRHATKAWLQLRLTRALGITANLEFTYLDRVLGALVGEGEALLERDPLQAQILATLFDAAWLAAPECASVRAYLHAAGSEAALVERRAVQLAGAVATQFEDYLLHRPELLAAWGRGEAGLDPEAEQAGVEGWQAALWRAVRGEGAAGVDLRQLIARVEAGGGEVPARLSLFGFTTLAPGYQELLVALARRGCALRLYVQQPCAVDGDGLLGRLWGRPGVEFRRTLQELAGRGGVDLEVHAPVGGDGEPSQPSAGDPGGDTPRPYAGAVPRGASDALLAQLQARLATGDDAPLTPADDDTSLQVLAAPSQQREVEGVASAIWQRVEAEGLRFDEVAVAVVDPLWDAYRGRIAAVFGEAHRLPTSLLEQPPGEASRVVDAVELLLGLPRVDFGRDDALRFLVHPHVQAGVEDADPAEWLGWCDELGVFHGADAEDRAGTYLERDLYSFGQAGQRLALGAFVGGGGDGQGPPVVALGEEAYLPAVLAAGQQASAARFGLVVQSLVADVRFAQTARLTLAEWSRFLRALVRGYVTAEGNESELYGRVLGRLARLGELEGDARGGGSGGARPADQGQPQAKPQQAPPPGEGQDPTGGAKAPRRYGYQAAADLALGLIQGVQPGRGRSLTGGVIVGPLRALAGLPFRALYVMGLNEGRFPAQPRRDLLDLRQAQRRPGDVTPQERDRFAFLTALAGVDGALVLSYVSRDEQTGERLAPSSLVHQLRAGLGGISDAEWAGLTVEVPLRRYDAGTFAAPLGQGPGALAERLPGARREAQARAAREDLGACLPAGAALPAPGEVLARIAPAARDALRPLVELDPLGQAGLAEGDPGGGVPRPRTGSAKAPATPAGSNPGDAGPLSVRTNALADFLASPLQAWGKHRLGLRDLDDADPLGEADEPFRSSALHATVLLREVFFAALGEVPAGRSLETAPLAPAYDRARLRHELAGRLPTGVFLEVERRRHLRVLESWLRNVVRHPGDAALRGLTTYSFGQAPRGEAGAVLGGPIEVAIELDGAPRQVRLHGSTRKILPGCAGSLQLGLSKDVRYVYRLRGFLDHVLLAAAGHTCEAEAFQILVSPGKWANLEHVKNLRAVRPFSQDEALAYLRCLLEDFLGNAHGYLLPVESVGPWLWSWQQSGERPDEPLAEVIEAEARSPWTTTSDDYGPVTALGRYGPPDEAEELGWARLGEFLRRRCESELDL